MKTKKSISKLADNFAKEFVKKSNYQKTPSTIKAKVYFESPRDVL